MDERQQAILFEESFGDLPARGGLYLVTSGWSYMGWEGTVYPPGTPAAGRLAAYVKHFVTVETDSTFYSTPRGSVVERWREVAPEGFLFAPGSRMRTEVRFRFFQESWPTPLLLPISTVALL